MRNILNNTMWSMALLLTVSITGCGSNNGGAAPGSAPLVPGAGTGAGGLGNGPAPVVLGGAGSFVILTTPGSRTSLRPR